MTHPSLTRQIPAKHRSADLRLKVLLGALLLPCVTSARSAAAPLDARGCQFIGLKSPKDFPRAPGTNSSETVFTSREFVARLACDELIVSWNATMPVESYLRVEARAIYPGRATKYYVMPTSDFRLANAPFPPHRATMQSHELLREVLQQTSAKQVAADLSLSLSMIYKWAEPDEGDGSGATNPLDRIEKLLRSTGDTRIVQWLCERAGGFFIVNPKVSKPHPDYLIPATNEIVQEFADLLSVIAFAAADNQITSKEAESIRARWEELKSVTEGFVVCCEAGNFSALKERPPSLASRK